MVKESKYYQGLFIPKNLKKYVGLHPINFRSSWERKFMGFLDFNPSVLEWSSESIIVPYYNPLKKRLCKYFPDFYMKVKEKSGVIKEYLVEIKPKKETVQPSGKGNRVLYEKLTYIQNISKWVFAKKFCEKKGWIFKLVTEKDLL